MDLPTHRNLATPGNPVLAVGDAAPEFELRRTFDESVKLSDLTTRGPVVVAFYVFDFGHV